MVYRTHVSGLLRCFTCFFVILQVLGLAGRVAGIILLHYDLELTFYSSFAGYLALYGLTIQSFGRASLVFEFVSFLFTMIGAKRLSIPCLVASLCSLSAAVTLHVINTIIVTWNSNTTFNEVPLWWSTTNVAIVVLHFFIGICLIKYAFQVKEIHYTRFREQIQRQERLNQSFPTVFMSGNYAASTQRVTPMSSVESLQATREQRIQLNQQLRSYFGQQEEVNPAFVGDDGTLGAHASSDLPPKYSEH